MQIAIGVKLNTLIPSQAATVLPTDNDPTLLMAMNFDAPATFLPIPDGTTDDVDLATLLHAVEVDA